MSENQKNLHKADAALKQFETEMDPERLREAYLALENVIVVEERDSARRSSLRRDSLDLWLHMLDLIDRFLDPQFDPNDVPELRVQPPPDSDGKTYPAGSDPTLIKDPQSRAKYEKAIAANLAKANNYRLQINLRRLNQSIPERAESFIHKSYASTPEDQKELRSAIDKIIKNPARKAYLFKLFTPTS